VRNLKSKKTIVSAAAAAAAIAVAAALAFAGHGQAQRSLPPGVTAGVSAFRTVPAAASIPPEVARFVDSAAQATASNAVEARGQIRVLRSDLGRAGRSVYGFLNVNGSPCVYVIGDSGFCAKRPADGTPGLHWAIGGGYAEVPSNLLGVASDDVVQVKLVIDGAEVPLSLKNNIAYAEFPQMAKRAEIVIIRGDGTSNAETINLQG